MLAIIALYGLPILHQTSVCKFLLWRKNMWWSIQILIIPLCRQHPIWFSVQGVIIFQSLSYHFQSLVNRCICKKRHNVMWIEDIAILNCQLGKIICQMFRTFDLTFSLAYHWWQNFSQRFWCLVRTWSHIIHDWSDWVTLFVDFGGTINTRRVVGGGI